MHNVLVNREDRGITHLAHNQEFDMIARTPTIAQARLREVLNYDPGSGVFTARYTRRGSRAKAGDQIGTFSPKDDCLLVSIDGRTYPLHNLAWLWVHGELPAKQLIKLDGNGRNVRISNLALSGAGIDLTQVRLKNFLAYDAETGIFRWKIRPAKNVQLGSIAGSLKLTRAADLTGAPNKFAPFISNAFLATPPGPFGCITLGCGGAFVPDPVVGLPV